MYYKIGYVKEFVSYAKSLQEDEIMSKKGNIIEKQNVLNEIKVHMTLQENRLFAIYLSRINPRNKETRIVKLKLIDYMVIMDITKVNIGKLAESTDSLLSIIIKIPNDRHGYDSFQLFKTCKLYKENDEWFIELDAHDESLPLIFDFQIKYFTYEVGNVLRLASSNQMRMYEILKQYETKGERIIAVEQLKAYLGIKEEDYVRFGDFKTKVLEVCKKSLKEKTDIIFSYESYGRKGKGGKILQLKFIIRKNKEYDNQTTIDDFFDNQKNDIIENITEIDKNEDFENPLEISQNPRIDFLCDACNNEFDRFEMEVIHDILINKLPWVEVKSEIDEYNYLKKKYDELIWRSQKTTIKNRFGYFKKILESEE